MGTWMQAEALINLFFQDLGAWLTPLMAAVSWLGTAYFYLFMVSLVYWCIDTALGIRIGLILMISQSVNGFLKVFFHSPRPYWVDSRVKAYAAESSFGLPSGHSQNSMSIFGVIAVSLRKKWVWVAALIIVLLIGISRLYLGVHFLRDVLGGWLVGILLLLLFSLLEAPVSQGFKQQKIWLRLGAAFLSALLMIAGGMLVRARTAGWTLPEPWVVAALQAAPGHPIDPFAFEDVLTVAGVWFGMISGLAFVVDGSGAHDPGGPILERVIRFLVGMLGLLAIYVGLDKLFPATPDLTGYFLRFIRYTLVGLYAVWLAPLIFIKLRLARRRIAV